MTICKKCNLGEFQEGFCKSHFIEIIEKRIKKNLRAKKYFVPHDKILITTKICNDLLPTLLGGLPVNIYFKNIMSNPKKFLEIEKKIIKPSLLLASRCKIKKIVLPITADDKLDGFMANVLFSNNEKKNIVPKYTYKSAIIIPLFESVTDLELNSYCAAKKLNFELKREHILDPLDERFKNIKFATLSSMSEFEEVEAIGAKLKQKNKVNNKIKIKSAKKLKNKIKKIKSKS